MEFANQIKSPLPLKKSPYYSRANDNFLTSPVRNYYMIAFNPGYALQASELNEMIELFFINQTLSSIAPANWYLYTGGAGAPNPPFATQESVGGNTNVVHTGMIPFHPDQIEITNATQRNVNGRDKAIINITVSPGWYSWHDPESGLIFWIYNDTEFTETLETTTADITTPEYIGFTVTKEEISCCGTGDDTECSELRDNSQGTTSTYNTCGAARLKLSISNVTLGDLDESSTFSAFAKVTLQENLADIPIISFLHYTGLQIYNS